MRTYYVNSDNPLYILHLPGNAKNKYKQLMIDEENRNIKINDNISIISIMNEPVLFDSSLNKQFINNNITFFNSEKLSKCPSNAWNNVYRIEEYINLLNDIDTEYVLILDGNDVVLLNNFDNKFIDKFNEFECDILYNYTVFEMPTHLNAGVCFGKRNKLIEFFNECLKYEKIFMKHKWQDQALISYVYNKSLFNIKIDKENKLFGIVHDSVLCNTNIIHIDDNEIRFKES